MDTAGIAGTTSPLDPGNNGFPGVSSNFVIGYNYPLIAMLGMISQLDGTFNFDKTGTALPQGAPLKRRFGADEYEFYVQDSFRLKPNLTINLWSALFLVLTPMGDQRDRGNPDRQPG